MDVRTFHAAYDRHHPDDRIGLFGAVAGHVDHGPVLYPGSYVDVAPSVYFHDVTYVDTDRRAARFFAHADPVRQLIDGKRAIVGRAPLGSGRVRFHQADYNGDLPVEDASITLLVSLYAGFVSERCGRYLASGGWLLANNSHGDASLAVLDPRFSLAAVVIGRDGVYRVDTDDPGSFMVPRGGRSPSAEELHRTNRGVAFTRAASAYLFRRG